jgi:hypothetical protein
MINGLIAGGLGVWLWEMKRDKGRGGYGISTCALKFLL